MARGRPVRSRVLDFNRYDRDVRLVLADFFRSVRYPTNLDRPSVFTVSETLGVRDAINRQATVVERYHFNRFQRSMRPFGITPIEGSPRVVTYLDEWRRENARLIESVHTRAAERVSDAVAQGFDDEQLSRQLRKEHRRARYNLKRISRDQTSKLVGSLSRIRQTDAGVTRYIWTTAGDRRVRPAHEELDSRIFTWQEGSPEGHPGEPPMCRCSAIPFVPTRREDRQPART